jgi:alpha-L-fucosidase 2
VSEFWLHRLTELDDGRLVAPSGWSPEHGPREDGVSYDQQLIAELFADALDAASALGLSDPLLDSIAAARRKLVAPRIGRWGQLQEWMDDRDDPDDRHRHTSHLVGVYPGRRINVTETPDLARAAEVSLRARGDTGDSRRSWTWPWRGALWARLRKPDGHRMLDGLVAYNLLPNALATHPPLQLDGNFGVTAGISEMLLQSHAGELDLLPGVDFTRWPRGCFYGLRARGGFEVSVAWDAGSIVRAELVSRLGSAVELRSPSFPSAVTGAADERVEFVRTTRGTAHFETRAGGRYTIAFQDRDGTTRDAL